MKDFITTCGSKIKSKIKNICVKKINAYFKKHSPLFSTKVTGQDVPQPEDDTMTAVETSVVDGVFPEEEKKTDQHVG